MVCATYQNATSARGDTAGHMHWLLCCPYSSLDNIIGLWVKCGTAEGKMRNGNCGKVGEMRNAEICVCG